MFTWMSIKHLTLWNPHHIIDYYALLNEEVLLTIRQIEFLNVEEYLLAFYITGDKGVWTSDMKIISSFAHPCKF